MLPLFCADRPRTFTFVDAFSGCGGLSLGFAAAGGQGLFAIEKGADAFLTFHKNFLLGPSALRFSWPTWLEQAPIGIKALIGEHKAELDKCRGKIDIVVGGPPCQGFSFAGKRRPSDPRNSLFKSYVEFISIVRPKVVVLENVPGMKAIHKRHADRKTRQSHYEKLLRALADSGYSADGRVLEASMFGVPQNRPRLIAVGVRKDLVHYLPGGVQQVFESIEFHREKNLKALGLTVPVTVADAISDLMTDGRALHPSLDSTSRRKFSAAEYSGPQSDYQRLLNEGCRLSMDSMRLANHTDVVRKRFAYILRCCERGTKVSARDRERLGMKKHRTVPLHGDLPAPTLTTLPDDVLHFHEPRILTVREYARLQSFPDWFEFKGKYTTGGVLRRSASPRYTQVGNAVPPLLAYAIACGVSECLKAFRVGSTKTLPQSSRRQPAIA